MCVCVYTHIYILSSCVRSGALPAALPAQAHGQDAHHRPDRLQQAARRPERHGGGHVLLWLRHRGCAHAQLGIARQRPRPLHGAQKVHLRAQEVPKRSVRAHRSAARRSVCASANRGGRQAAASAAAVPEVPRCGGGRNLRRWREALHRRHPSQQGDAVDCRWG